MNPSPAPVSDAAQLQRRVDAHPFWYHTIDIAPGVTTPGWFDLRPIVDRMPWPDVRGKRCLDIGTFDGYLAFELERRGAAEVTAVDVEDHLEWDWPPDYRAADLARDPGFTGEGAAKNDGFRLAHELMGSQVRYRQLSIYDLDPAEVGTFDVVVCGSLLLHLRDPLRALEAVRSVTDGVFLSAEQIEVGLSLVARRRPLYRLNGSGKDAQWWLANAAGHDRMLYAAGFGIDQRTEPYVIPFSGPHPTAVRGVKPRLRRAATWALTRSRTPGVLHRAALARPRV
ncbi:methyltransferase domain-containing protein [Nitriliruptoraceae bacterium ZYF776]|nr:methyltransferase domain-containing protein [Profundirhabdus halotolerans]